MERTKRDGHPHRESGRTHWVSWLALLLVGAVGYGMVACSSMSKATLERRLFDLEKNAPAKARGLSRLPITVNLHGQTQQVELVYLHVPAANGDPEGDPVVLVHGTPATLFTWVPVIFGEPGVPGLSATRDVYAIEVIGHGVAPGDGSPYTFETCADFVVAAIRGLGLERVNLVGNSYGGEFVWRAALNAPELIHSVTLMHASGYARKDGEWLPEEVVMRENRLAKFGWLLNSRKRVLSALEPHFRGVPPERAEEIFLVCENAHNWKAMIDLVRDENGSREHELGHIACPALILWGAREIAYPLETFGQRFVHDIPGAQLRVLDDCGHYPQEEHPALVVAALGEFFRSLENQAENR